MLQSLILHIIAGIGGLAIAIRFIADVQTNGDIQTLLFAGAVLGFMNGMIKPILNILTLPIRILTLGFSSLLLNVLMVFLVDVVFTDAFEIEGLLPLLYTTFIVWILSLILHIFGKGKFTTQ